VITFHEFVVWAHRLQDVEIRKFKCFFCTADADGDGLISLTELLNAMKKVGFTLFEQTVDEILAEIDKKRDMTFNFCDFVGFVNACAKRDGFNSKELQNLVDAYRKHDTGSGMNNFEVAGLLRYLGYDIHLQDVHRYMKQVDFNGNGAMDFGEFLRLMRIHREEELTRLRKIFDTTCDTNSGKLHSSDLDVTCEEAGFETDEKHLQRLRSERGDPESLDFEGFVHVVDALREINISRKRQRAGFSDREFTLISNLWQKYNTGGKGKLDKGNIILLLIDAGVPMNQAEERARVFEMLGEARIEAIKSGIAPDDVGRPSSPRLTFWPLVHLLRALLVMGEKNTLLREDQAVVETAFERREVADFRDIFLECGMWAVYGDASFDSPEDAPPTSAGISPKSFNRKSRMLIRRASLSDMPTKPQDLSRVHDWGSQAEVENQPNATLKDLLNGNVNLIRATKKSIQVILSRKLGMRFNAENREQLEQKVLEISPKQEDSLDFADFLRLMRWILDTNFANINDIANTITEEVTKSKREAARARMIMAGIVVRSTIRLRSVMGSSVKRDAMKRRSSI